MTEAATLTCPKTTRVLIIDDHPAVREGLLYRLGRVAHLEVCGEADDAASALELVSQTLPDLVIVDISLKSGNGIDLVKRIKLLDDSIRILVWSMHPDSIYAERAIRAGAQGYINKEQATDKMVEAIAQVLAGRIYLSEPMANKILQLAAGGRQMLEQSPVERLSDRELEAFRLLGQGLDSHQVAMQMHITSRTVDTYRARIKTKLKCQTGRQLVQCAIQWVLETA